MQLLTDAAVKKLAKKSLKRQDSGQMKLKALAKTVAEKHEDLTVQSVKEIIQSSSKFHVHPDGKMVTLLKNKRKRSSVSSKEGDADADADDEPSKQKESQTKTQKKSKKNKKKTHTGEKDNLTSAEAQSWRQQHKIVVLPAQDGGAAAASALLPRSSHIAKESDYFPWTTFAHAQSLSSSSLHASLLDHCVTANGFAKPSPIQAQSWPLLVAQRDVVGIAETGSGKTLAFALPLLSAMVAAASSPNQQQQKYRSPRMLVLSPTRELAMQSDQVLSEFGAVVGLQSLVVYGGVPKHTQVSALKRGNVDCLVATPGRLQDLLQNSGVCGLSRVRYLVLDEADRMLDSGFEEEVRSIVAQCQQEGRQTAMFSATWPAEIQRLAMDFMNDPVRVYVGFESIVGSNGENNVDDSLSANKRVQQRVEVIEDRQRDRRLREVLQQLHGQDRQDRVLVFALYKKEAERLENALRRDGWKCCSIHGNKNQQARTEALAQFKDGSCPLMVATDVAARGLDIPNVEAVINYTFPLTIEDYIHRIGRTGRAGKTGISYTFFQPTDKSHAGELQQVLRQVGQEVPDELAKFGSTIKKKEHKLYGNFGPKDGQMKKATKIKFDYDSDE